ncbi:AAA family ATPase [Thalassotalea piscium]
MQEKKLSNYELTMQQLNKLVNFDENITKPVLCNISSTLLARVLLPLNDEQQEYLFSLLSIDKKRHAKGKVKRLEYLYLGFYKTLNKVESDKERKRIEDRAEELLYLRAYRAVKKIIRTCEIFKGNLPFSEKSIELKTKVYTTKKVFNLADLEAELIFRNNDNGVNIVQEVLNKGNEKKVLIADEKMMISFEQMYMLFPNFHNVISEVHASLKLSLYAGLPIEFPIINLNGPPGIGKTYFVKTLCKVLGLDFHDASIATMTGKQDLIGGSSQFKSASIGEIAKALLIKTDTFQPIVLLDELCLAKNEGEYSIVPSLLSLFDYEQKKCVKERYLDLDMDCSGILFFTTTNNIENLLPAVKSRLTNFNILPPNPDEMYDVCNEIYRSFLTEKKINKLFVEGLNLEVTPLLRTMTPRDAKTTIISGIKRALVRSHNNDKPISVLPSDITHIINSSYSVNATIGFIH